MKKHINGRGKNKPVTFCIGLLDKAKSFNQANKISLAVNHQTGLTVQLTIPLRCLNANSLESWSKSSLPSFSHYGNFQRRLLSKHCITGVNGKWKSFCLFL